MKRIYQNVVSSDVELFIGKEIEKTIFNKQKTLFVANTIPCNLIQKIAYENQCEHMKQNLWIIPIEPLDMRYTKQWYENLPITLSNSLNDIFNVIQIEVPFENLYEKPQTGAFFDFAETCNFKSAQAQKISKMFKNGDIKKNDIFLFTDAWNPTVHIIRYISELNQIPVYCTGIWHAGHYDPTDILGFSIQNKNWIDSFEYSLANSYDISFFATQHHHDKFKNYFENIFEKIISKLIVCGQPHEHLFNLQNNEIKENLVVFPHRLNSDKSPFIFDLIKDNVQKKRPEILFIKTQELNLNKDEYYKLLKKCKVVFSANKHENLGIGVVEAMVCGCIPLVPNRLSYQEMYQSIFKYDYDNVDKYSITLVENLSERIIYFIDNYYKPILYNNWRSNLLFILNHFFTCKKMINCLKELKM